MIKINKNLKKISGFITYFLIILYFIIPINIQAQSGSGQPNPSGSGQPSAGQQTSISIKTKIINPFKQETIPELIETIVKEILVPVGTAVAVVMIIYAGFLYVTAGGNETQIKKAHDALLWAVIGAAILLGAYIISQAIQGTISQLQSG